MAESHASLAELLRLAEWSPRQFVTAINARLSSQGRERLRLDPTAGYSWVRRGFRPRPPIPDVAAVVLSERLGYPVTTAQLWPGRHERAAPTATATSELDSVTGVDDLLRELSQLATTAVTPQCPIVAASAADLTAAVFDQLRGAVLAARDRAGHDTVLPEQVELIAGHVTALRRLDDRHGGGALSLRYVTAELRSVIELVEYASYGPWTGKRLLTIVADLAQLLGWLRFDSSRHGAAERYLLLSLGICRALDAPDRAANAIGMLSYVSAFAGHGAQAVHLAEAASAECGKGDPILRARLLGREATAAAADGDLARFRRRSEQAAELLQRYDTADGPPFLYYLTPAQLAAETGQGLLALAERTTTSRRRLLTEAVTTLSTALPAMATAGPGASTPVYPRSALLHTTFLARACLLRGDLEETVAAMRTGLSLLKQVQSPRARGYLRALWPDLARRSRSLAVRDFLDEFAAASSPL